MAKIISAVLYIMVFIPVWFVRRAFGIGRYERVFHNGVTAWDLPIDITRSSK